MARMHSKLLPFWKGQTCRFGLPEEALDLTIDDLVFDDEMRPVAVVAHDRSGKFVIPWTAIRYVEMDA